MNTQNRLDELRDRLRAQDISWGELHELQSLADEIDPGDLELLEAAGVTEVEAGYRAAGYTPKQARAIMAANDETGE
jgi:hypothetical protein